MNLYTEKNELLTGLINLSPQQNAEDLDFTALLPGTLLIPNHLKALDPSVLLIIGGRGAGKTHLFRVITSQKENLSLPEQTEFNSSYRIIGYATKEPEANKILFPNDQVMQNFVGKIKGNRTALMFFWQALIVASLYKSESLSLDWENSGLPKNLFTAFDRLNEVSFWYDVAKPLQEKLDTFFSSLDAQLDKENRFLFVSYDDLDVIAVDWEEKRDLITSLLQFWQSQWRRFKKIRCKIFLRRDLFSKEFLKFPDASKFDTHKHELTWTYVQLYQLLLKSWANQNDLCRNYLSSFGLRFKYDTNFGWIFNDITQVDETLIRTVINAVVGEFMGSGKTKGASYTWIPNHLQDGNREIFPRSLLQLFAVAANEEIQKPKALDERLIYFSYFVSALDIVSERRLQEVTEEVGWINEVKGVLCDKTVPMEKEEMRELLAKVKFKDEYLGGLPSNTSPEGILDSLIQLGLFRKTDEGKIHVQDVYLKGFGLKRKGGVRRPK